jgi:NAD(P)-dependent dehydrogenase (short-subunit alcohol dehydrogenase family)
VPNYKEPDPELGTLNLSQGGAYPVEYALRLAAGFGSQIAMTLLHRTPVPDGRRRSPGELGYAYRIVDPAAWQRWLDLVSGHPGATLEVSQRRLRVVDTGPARTAPTTPPAIALPASAPPAPPAPVVPPPVVSAPTGPAPTGPAPETPAAAPAVPSMRAPVPSAPSAPSAPAPAESASDPVIGEVVRMVSQMTGYPPELLDLDLDLEADLGVDTVKQAEVFAAVRERWDIPRQDDLRLRDFPTLNHVIAWVHDKTGATATPPTDGTPELAPAAPSAPAAEAADPVVEQVVQIVSQMTGYPPELLDLDLDLEADLGVDTVKQAEVFAAVRERWDIPRQDDLRLRDFPTLNHVIAWVHDKTGATATPPTDGTPTAPATPAAEPQPTDRQRAVPQVSVVRGDLTATDRIPRRTPVPMLRPDLSQCTPTGVTLESGTRAVVALDEGGVGDLLVKKLRRRGVDVLGFEPGTATEEILAALDGWLTEGAVHGVFWLPALDDEGPLEQLDPVQWHEALRRRVKALYATMRRLYDGSPFLITGTRMGGFHGYDAAGATAPLGGAVTGFAKSYRRERPEALVKAVDVPAGRRTAAVADLLIEEALRDPGCVEVGLVDDRRWGVGLVERPFPALEADGRPDGEGGLRLGPQTVVAVTGAAGSIVSAITADLAAVSGGVFHLLDLTPAPDPEDPDLRLFVEDREALKAALAGRLRTTGERPTPVAIDKELARFERLQMALAAIRAVEQAGGTAHYHCVDLTDSEAVAEVMRSVRELSGRIDVLLHAAGLEISRNLPDKQPREYDLVFDVKSDGFFNVLAGAGDLPIGATVVFSSVAGRFGNAGQTDYSAANDLMCKIISSFRRTRPGTRGIALDWTAWGTIGMATRGSIPKIMEQAGVQLLPAEAGVAWTRRELSASPFRGEVVVAGELGLMAAEFHPTGGLDLTAVSPEGCGPMVDTVEKLSVHDGLVVSTTLDPTAQPFLDHHRIDGTAVLPGVMGMEGFAEAAALLAPGWRVAGLEDVTFANPVKFYRDEPRTLTISALLQPDDGVQGSTDGEVLLADCRLTAQRQLPGSDVPQTTAHFAGRVRLCRQPAREPGTTPDTGPAAQENGLQEKGAQENGVQEKGAQENGVQENGAPRLGPDDVYALYFHGPAYQVVSAAWREGPDAVARLNDGLGPDHRPEEVPLLIGPRLVELCFQDAGLWEAGNTGRLALPMRVARLRLLADPAATPQGPVHATARPGSEGTGAEVFDCAVVDGSGRVLLRMDGYATVALPSPVAGELGARLHEVMGPVPAPAEG